MSGGFQVGSSRVIAFLASFAWGYAAHAQLADTIDTGGDIVTKNDTRPTVDAIAVKDGKILAIGTPGALENAHQGPSTKVVDLARKSLVPGFVDGHAHFH